jgi:hypothetical protein
MYHIVFLILTCAFSVSRRINAADKEIGLRQESSLTKNKFTGINKLAENFMKFSFNIISIITRRDAAS